MIFIPSFQPANGSIIKPLRGCKASVAFPIKQPKLVIGGGGGDDEEGLLKFQNMPAPFPSATPSPAPLVFPSPSQGASETRLPGPRFVDWQFRPMGSRVVQSGAITCCCSLDCTSLLCWLGRCWGGGRLIQKEPSLLGPWDLRQAPCLSGPWLGHLVCREPFYQTSSLRKITPSFLPRGVLQTAAGIPSVQTGSDLLPGWENAPWKSDFIFQR